MKNIVLHFVRNGQTGSNERGEYVGRRSDPELSLEGIRELIALREEYEYPPPELVYSSPLHRCLQTADILYPGSRVMLADELAEMDFGDFDGRSLEELKDRGDFREWLADSGRAAPPGGESGKAFLIRIEAALDAVVSHARASGLREAAVVTHGGVISTLLAVTGVPRRPPRAWKAAPGRGFTCFVNPALWDRGRAMEVAGIVPHGAATAFPSGADG